jgi:hypothetical protein
MTNNTTGILIYNRGVDFIDVVNLMLSNAGITKTYNHTGFGDSYLNQLYLTQMSDVLDPYAFEPASIMKISFSDLMSEIKGIFNAKWFINDTNFRIENVSYFESTDIIDLTTFTDENGIAFCRNSYKYEVEEEEFPKEETYEFVESKEENNTGVPIKYSGICIDKEGRTKDFVTENIITDLQGITQQAENFSNDNILLVVTSNAGGLNIVRSEAGSLTGETAINRRLDWANLQENYYKNRRPLENFTMNNSSQTAISTKKTKKVEEFQIPFCKLANEIGAFDEFNRYTTFWNNLQSGDNAVGNLDYAELDLQTNMMTLRLKYTNTY